MIEINEELNRKTRKKLANRAIQLGLVTNIFLATVKTGFGIFGGSPALLADGINSVSDVAYYMVVSVFMRLAGKPADDEHPYGHNQLESIAALVIGAFVITTAITIFWRSVNSVYEILSAQVVPTAAASITLVIALLTIIIKIAIIKPDVACNLFELNRLPSNSGKVTALRERPIFLVLNP